MRCTSCGKETNGLLCETCEGRIRQEYRQWLRSGQKGRMSHCIVCGMSTSGSKSFYVCKTPECKAAFDPIYQEEYRLWRNRKIRVRTQEGYYKRKNELKFIRENSKILEAERKARELGMSYGQYMAAMRRQEP